MTFKAWLAVFIASMVACAGLLAGFNALIDPFGLFGDKLSDWWAYDMTQNPRTAKIGWLEQRQASYDSYIVGCSKTSSFPNELLDRYYASARFYNMTMYGGDLHDVELTVAHILDNYGAKNIVVVTGLDELTVWDYEDDDMKGNLHAVVDGSSKLRFYTKYLFANPSYAISKIEAMRKSGYLVSPDKVFVPETGEYDKSLRDVELIGSLDAYLRKYPAFVEKGAPYGDLRHAETCLSAIARIKERCEEAGATFTLILSPMYAGELDLYPLDAVLQFLRDLASVTDYWDFTGYHSVSYEPRYFYDAFHHRNAVGAMALAKMFDDSSIYVPEDFGVHVTQGNVNDRLARYVVEPPDLSANDCLLTVLMYHDVKTAQGGDYSVTGETLRAQLLALKEAGYASVSFEQVIAYVERGAPLPAKPLVITMDDGYEGCVTIAAPILAELGMCATVNPIGVSIGKSEYKDTGVPITPHFALEDALPWVRSGVLSIQSHGFDMHHVPELDRDVYRQGVLPKPGENEERYIEEFRADFASSREAIEDALHAPVTVYAYPFGLNTELTEVLLSEMGVKVTLTVEEGINTIVKGLPQSLRGLRRCSVSENLSPSALLDYVEGLRQGGSDE